jgi:hypothetical protein
MPQRDRHWFSLINAGQVVFGTEEQCQLEGEMPHRKIFGCIVDNSEVVRLLANNRHSTH